MRCWNCLQEVPPKGHTCPFCEQPLRPNPAQTTAAKGRLNYLVAESSQWGFLPPEVRQQLACIYQNRTERLQQVANGSRSVLWPESDWTDPIWQNLPLAKKPALSAAEDAFQEPAQQIPEVRTAPVAAETISLEQELVSQDTLRQGSLEGVLEATEPVPVTNVSSEQVTPEQRTLHQGPLFQPLEKAFETTQSPTDPADISAPPVPPQHIEKFTPRVQESVGSKVLAEADIRWFHSLGALLVIAAVVGWLRATWDGYGKNLAGLMILFSPVGMQALAFQMQRSVPLSARLLSILAGLLTAPALLAAEVFDFLPPEVSGKDYWSFSLLVTAALLGWQAQHMKERIPLHVGALCAVMAGWSQGALLTSVLCLMVGFLLAPIKTPENASDKEQSWAEDLRRIGFAAGLFGCFSALFLFNPDRAPWTPLVTFSAALIYLHLPTLTRNPSGNTQNRVAIQAAISVLGMLLMRWALDVPASGVGLYALLAAGLFLAARPEDESGLLALKVGSYLSLLGLAIGFFSGPMSLPGENFADPASTAMRFLLAFVGAGLFGYLSRQPHLESVRQILGLTAMFSTFGGSYHLLRLVTPEPRLAPMVAGFGLWVFLWVVASRWLRSHEQTLVTTVAALVLAVNTFVAITVGLGQNWPSHPWAQVLLWLGGVALAWERGLLAPRPSSSEEKETVASSLTEGLSRLALWSLALAPVISGLLPQSHAALALQGLGLLLLLAPLGRYRQPGLEMVWMCALPALMTEWNSHPFPGQIAPVLLLIASGWAASNSLRSLALGASATVSLGVLLGSLPTASHLSLLVLPLVYGLACALPPLGREWTSPGAVRYGFDALLCAAIFLPLRLPPQSVASLSVTIGIPLFVLALRHVISITFVDRVFTHATPYALLTSGLVWSLLQGPREAGLLLLLGSVWAFTLNDPEVNTTTSRDLANGMAIWGACWIVSPSFLDVNYQALAGAVAVSEMVALTTRNWLPNVSNSAFIALLGLQNARTMDDLEIGLTLLAGGLGLLRGLARTQLLVAGISLTALLLQIDHQLEIVDDSLKIRLLPLAIVCIAVGFWLTLQPEHPTRQSLKVPPLACLRLGVALLSLPPLLSLAINAELNDFIWVLTVGCSCLGLSGAFPRHEELRLQLRQLGGWILTAWAAVSLGRAAMKLPWQLATLVVGLVLLVLGVAVERRRKNQSETGS